MGRGVLGGRAGGVAGAAVHGGAGAEARLQATAEGEGGDGDHEQHVEPAEGQPDPRLAAEEHELQTGAGGGLRRLGEIKLYS